MSENEYTYTLETNHWTGKMEAWKPSGKLWSTSDDSTAIKYLAYHRFAYPKSNFSLHKNGFIFTSKEIAEISYHLINS